jgi:hypothetical protein
VLGMGDDEVRLALDRRPGTGQHPVDAVVHDVGVVELLEEPFVQSPLGRALRGEHGERDHPGHRWIVGRAGRRFDTLGREASPSLVYGAGLLIPLGCKPLVRSNRTASAQRP